MREKICLESKRRKIVIEGLRRNDFANSSCPVQSGQWLKLSPVWKIQTASSPSRCLVFCGLRKLGHKNSRQMAAFFKLLPLPENSIPAFKQISFSLSRNEYKYLKRIRGCLQGRMEPEGYSCRLLRCILWNFQQSQIQAIMFI